MCFLGRADPDCALGHLLKMLFRNDEFMDKLVNSYIMSTVEEFDLNCIAARVLLNAMPGLESAAVFQDMASLGEVVTLNHFSHFSSLIAEGLLLVFSTD